MENQSGDAGNQGGNLKHSGRNDIENGNNKFKIIENKHICKNLVSHI